MSKLNTVAQLSQKQPAFSQASIRWLIFRSKENGLEQSGAIVRLGRRVLVDEEKFVEWVRSQSTGAKAAA